VHSILATVPLDASRGDVDQAAATHAAILGAEAREAAAAAESVWGALAHPVLRRAWQAEQVGDCRRECPVALRLEDGRLLEGVVDLAFREAGHWVVVDYKTDLEMGVREEPYREQVGYYVRAIREATGLPAEGVILRL
jgi:ATP-dependent exoDNAse (exonuclease V) beta subunit